MRNYVYLRLLALLAVTIIAVSALPGMTAHKNVRLDGTYLKAFLVAFSEHSKMDDLTARQKQLDGYSIEFSQDESFIYVYFMPKMPRGWRTFGGDTPNGRSARYTIDKHTFAVRQQQLFK